MKDHKLPNSDNIQGHAMTILVSMPLDSQQIKQQNIFTKDVAECRLSKPKSELNQFSGEQYSLFI